MRLIHLESRFNPLAVSPKGAQGIAQFMPATAAERGLADPFDPIAALPASAALLRDLNGQFGNLGLAAAAYNAGAGRVSGWLSGKGRLPGETQRYERLVTGLAVEAWVRAEPGGHAARLQEHDDAIPRCPDMPILAAAPAAPPVVPAGEPALASGPWGVEVATGYSRNGAVSDFTALQRRYPKVLGGKPMMIQRIVLRASGPRPFFRLRVPAATREAAQKLCGTLRAAGGRGVVLKS